MSIVRPMMDTGIICDFCHLDTTWRNVFGVLYLVLCVASIFLNGTVLVKLYRRNTTTNTDIILAAVVLIDFFTGALIGFVDSAEILDDGLMRVQYVDITRRYLTSTLFAATANTMTFLTVEINYTTTRGKARHRRARSTVYALIVICIVSPGVTSILLLFKDVARVYALGVVLQFTPVLGVVLYYYSSLIIALSSGRNVKRRRFDHESDEMTRRRDASDVVAMVTLFVVLNVPFAIHHLQYIIGHDFGAALLSKSHSVVHLLFVLRSVCNPIVYLCGKKRPEVGQIAVL